MTSVYVELPRDQVRERVPIMCIGPSVGADVTSKRLALTLEVPTLATITTVFWCRSNSN